MPPIPWRGRQQETDRRHERRAADSPGQRCPRSGGCYSDASGSESGKSSRAARREACLSARRQNGEYLHCGACSAALPVALAERNLRGSQRFAPGVFSQETIFLCCSRHIKTGPGADERRAPQDLEVLFCSGMMGIRSHLLSHCVWQFTVLLFSGSLNRSCGQTLKRAARGNRRGCQRFENGMTIRRPIFLRGGKATALASRHQGSPLPAG